MNLMSLFDQCWRQILSIASTVVFIFCLDVGLAIVKAHAALSCNSIFFDSLQTDVRDRMLWPLRFSKGIFYGLNDFNILVSASPQMWALARELGVNPNTYVSRAAGDAGVDAALAAMSKVLNQSGYGPFEYVKEKLKTNPSALAYIESMYGMAQRQNISIHWQEQVTAASQRQIGKVNIYLGAMFTSSPLTTVALALAHELAHSNFDVIVENRNVPMDDFVDLYLRRMLADEIVAIRAEKTTYEKLRQLGVDVKMKGVGDNTRKIWSVLNTATETQLENAIGNLGYNSSYTHALIRLWAYHMQRLDKEHLIASIMEKKDGFGPEDFIVTLSQGQYFKELTSLTKAKYVKSMILTVSQFFEEQKLSDLRAIVSNPAFEVTAVNLAIHYHHSP